MIPSRQNYSSMEAWADALVQALTAKGQSQADLDAEHIQGILDEARVPFESPGPIGSVVPGTGKFTNIELTGVPPSGPKQNTLYKHPNAGGQLIATLDASSVEAALAGVLDAAQGGIAAGALEDWHEVGATDEPAFQNSWVNFGGSFSTAAFRKLPSGLVVFKGLVKSGTINTLLFRLPVGYRPKASMIFPGQSNNVIARMDTRANGDVIPINGSTLSMTLDMVMFMADG